MLALLLAGLAFAARFTYIMLFDKRAAFAEPTPKPVSTAAPADTATATPEPTVTLSPEELLALQADLEFMKDRVNILLAGIDYAQERTGRDDFRTDTLMLFSVNFSTERVDIISIPRDSYADIAFTDRNWKINGAFMSAGGAEGRGFECMMETVSTALGGLPIGYYFAVDMPAVKDIVDIIGGVWYEVDYDIKMGGRQISKGYQLLDGQAFLDYSRARKGITSGTDVDRIDRQQRLLLEMFKQAKQSNLLPKIPQIYDTMKSQVYTNLNFEQIAALSLFALDLDMENKMGRYALKGKYLQYRSMYYVLDHTYTRELITELFGFKPNINWRYSLEYALADMAAMAFDESLLRLQNYLISSRADLSEELINRAEAGINDWIIMRDDFAQKLDSAGRSKSFKKIDFKGMEQQKKAIDALYSELVAYKPDPSPLPTGEGGGDDDDDNGG